jgi:hypothetical protein
MFHTEEAMRQHLLIIALLCALTARHPVETGHAAPVRGAHPGTVLTMLDEQSFRCTVCGKKSTHTVIVSTNTIGGRMDLDTRPPEMQRSTMFAWLQRCPHCGYCAGDISDPDPQARAIVRSPGYRKLLAQHPNAPFIATALCRAHLLAAEKKYGEAVWPLLYAAWEADDARKREDARTIRKRAYEMIGTARASGQACASNAESERILEIDLLRRSGRFQEAFTFIERARPASKGFMRLIIDYERTLVRSYDDAAHSLDEVPGIDRAS